MLTKSIVIVQSNIGLVHDFNNTHIHGSSQIITHKVLTCLTSALKYSVFQLNDTHIYEKY